MTRRWQLVSAPEVAAQVERRPFCEGCSGGLLGTAVVHGRGLLWLLVADGGAYLYHLSCGDKEQRVAPDTRPLLTRRQVEAVLAAGREARR